jgi:hypothetical protein
MEKENDNDFAIHVALVDDAIIVTMPGTRYSITYRKGADPWLLASDRDDDPDFPPRNEEKNLRDALARLKKVEGRGPHFSWTERNALYNARVAIERRLSPDAVSTLLETTNRLHGAG